MSYLADPNTEGSIQKIYISQTLDNNADVWMVQFKTGHEKILNLVNPFTLKFDTDRKAVLRAQNILKKKNPRSFICTIM